MSKLTVTFNVNYISFYVCQNWFVEYRQRLLLKSESLYSWCGRPSPCFQCTFMKIQSELCSRTSKGSFLFSQQWFNLNQLQVILSDYWNSWLSFVATMVHYKKKYKLKFPFIELADGKTMTSNFRSIFYIFTTCAPTITSTVYLYS